MTAPATAGAYHYGACVDAVTDESDTTNNCSSSVKVTVAAPEPAPETGVNQPALEPLELSTLQVSGGGSTMYPAFDADILHYALKCSNSTTLQVDAKAKRSGATLTLLRANPDDNHVSTGTLDAQVSVSQDHDVAIELSDAGDDLTYVVHCLPSGLPDIAILARTDGASTGLLFIVSDGFRAIVDYNGVPRNHAPLGGRNFRPHAAGPLIDGKRVRYSSVSSSGAGLLDANFTEITTATPVAPLKADDHDFVLGTDSYLFISYVGATRDFSPWDESLSTSEEVRDSVITEVAFAGPNAGTERFRWNSWDHLQIRPDCSVLRSAGEYAHLNSIQRLANGDIIASFRGCAQVVRIDGDTGALKWKLGGSDPPRSSDTEYLEIVDDPLGEFCGQHHATLTDNGRILLFDNGVHCLGSRKTEAVVTRVVEYNISSGTRAELTREYRRPAMHGYSPHLGGVTLLDNGNWLISWGATRGKATTLSAQEVAVVSEVDTTGAAVFHMNMSKSDKLRHSYRVYHDYEANVPIPLNLP